MSFIVRPVKQDDLKDLILLSGKTKLYNLPSEESKLSKLIEIGIKSFSGDLDFFDTCYFFVLEDRNKKKVVGTAQIKAQKHPEGQPNYTFKVFFEKKHSYSLNKTVAHQKLKLMANWDPVTELRALGLSSEYRSHPMKLGYLLITSRLAYMSIHNQKFHKTVYSEIFPGGEAFWNFFSGRFIPMDYSDADLRSQNDQEFFSSLLPKEDIYVSMLPKEVQNIIGQERSLSTPARKMLERVGFIYRSHIDPLDGGPCLWTELSSTIVYQSLVAASVEEITDTLKEGKPYMLSNGFSTNFRCINSKVVVKNIKVNTGMHNTGEVELTTAVANALQVKKGDTIYAVSYA